MAKFRVGDRVRLMRLNREVWTAGVPVGYITAATRDGYKVRFDDGVEVLGYTEDELERAEETDRPRDDEGK
jgi:hypothetical protein